MQKEISKGMFSYKVYVAQEGWLGPIKSGEVVLFPERKIVKFDFLDSKIHFSILTKDGWVGEKETSIIKRNESVFGVKLWTEDENEVFYRCYFEKSGWEMLCRAGQLCIDKNNSRLAGIQIFTTKDTTFNLAMCHAEEELNRCNMYLKQMYISNKHSFIPRAVRDYCDPNHCEIEEIEYGTILPLKRVEQSSRNGIYSGGVCNKDGTFFAGFSRNESKCINLSCSEAYNITDNLEAEDEEVVYGGVLTGLFGHLFAECLSRLWYICSEKYRALHEKKIVFLVIPDQKRPTEDFFRLMGIDLNNVKYITRPMRYRKIYVPEQSVIAYSSYHPEYKNIFNLIKKNVKKGEYKKIYLTRRLWYKNDVINEEYFENFFRRRGYKVVSPERLSVFEQISIVSGANEIVCTEGTLGHLAIFCDDNIKITLLRRAEHKKEIILQYIINQCRNVNVSYVDVSHNFFPVTHVAGVFLLGWTELFRNYLQDRGMPYYANEDKFCLNEHVYTYLDRWVEKFSNIHEFNEIAYADVLDFINSIRKELGMDVLAANNYPTKGYKQAEELVKNKNILEGLKKDNHELRSKIDANVLMFNELKTENSMLINKLNNKEQELEQLQNSLSWKLTKPFRDLLFFIKGDSNERKDDGTVQN